jgi:hypothetical protein
VASSRSMDLHTLISYYEIQYQAPEHVAPLFRVL